MTADSNISIPDSKFAGERIPGKTRPVVVVFSHPYNSEPTYPIVVVAPLSTRVDMRKDCDLELQPEPDRVRERCLLRLGLIQPVCKVDLAGPRAESQTKRSTR
ncbi:MAG: type II toxin-antitoxin system PemK/MazF family toxin [Acetobacteraceae bacterium]|nr:type II toxin-antitoxin system PemK/MazF family toxin [Acetobacteraceae bacterium]